MKKKAFVFILLLLATMAFAHQSVPNERDWLKHKYLPSLDGRVLFVGVNYYNSDYHTFAKNPELYETIDFVAERAQFGSPYKHHVGDFLTFDPGYKYDHICLFGVMGHYGDISGGEFYNIDDSDAITKALEHAHRLLKMGGTLQVGPNRICVPAYNTQFWIHRLAKYPLDKYEILLNAMGPCNMVWWGKKVTH